jgi:hypothetical protein
MTEFDYRITHFLKTNDMPCAECGYNLRALVGLDCPECGARQPYSEYAEFVEYRRKHEILEVGEFRFVRKVGTLFTGILLVDALILAVAGSLPSGSSFYWLLAAAFVAVAVANTVVLVRLFYTRLQHTTVFWNRKTDRTRDQYGVLVLIVIIPSVAFSVLFIMRIL